MVTDTLDTLPGIVMPFPLLSEVYDTCGQEPTQNKIGFV